MAAKLGLSLVVVSVMLHGAWAQAGCSNVLTSLAPCLNFVTGNSTKPSSTCCSSFTGVIQTQPQCLCMLVNGGGPMAGITINQTLALALPAACNMQSPPVSQCNVASGPTTSVGSPTTAPVASPSSDSTLGSSLNDTPATTNTPSTATNTPSSTGTGSKSTPSVTGASSGVSSISSPFPVAMFLSLAVSFVLRATKF